MRHVYKSLPVQQRDLGNQLIMVGAHPELTRGAVGFPQCHTLRFSSPEFEPQATTGAECFGIGSGEAVEKYRTAATEASSDFSFHQTVVVGLKWPAHTMASILHKIVSDDPSPGVSPWFLYGTVSLTEWLIEGFVYTAYEESGPKAYGVATSIHAAADAETLDGPDGHAHRIEEGSWSPGRGSPLRDGVPTRDLIRGEHHDE
jgi:hypothetical protein